MPHWFYDMCVPELLLPHKIIRMFGLKTTIFAQKYAFFGTYRPCRLIWCPAGWLVGGCGAWAVSRKTPIIIHLFIHVYVVHNMNYIIAIAPGLMQRSQHFTEGEGV